MVMHMKNNISSKYKINVEFDHYEEYGEVYTETVIKTFYLYDYEQLAPGLYTIKQSLFTKKEMAENKMSLISKAVRVYNDTHKNKIDRVSNLMREDK